MILEGIVTSLDLQGELNVAPMGPIVDESLTTLRLRPFKTAKTYANLKARPYGVFHVTDDVLLLARAVIGRLPARPETFPAKTVEGAVLRDACRWYEFRVEDFDDAEPRTSLLARVVHCGRIRDFLGFNRAKHFVLEAAILASRLHLLPPEQVLKDLAAWRIPVEKTAGPRETEAFELICRYANDFYAPPVE